MTARIAVAAALLLTAWTFSVDAQGTKKKPKEDEGTVEVYKTDAGKWRYRVKNAEGKTIAIPLAQMHWDTKAETLKAVAELKEILNSATPTEVKETAKTEKTETKEKTDDKK